MDLHVGLERIMQYETHLKRNENKKKKNEKLNLCEIKKMQKNKRFNTRVNKEREIMWFKEGER